MKDIIQRTFVAGAFISGMMILLADSYTPKLLIDYAGPDETVHIKSFQYADVAGVGKAIGQHDDALVIDVERFWMGSFTTNPVSIYQAFGEWSDGISRDNTNYYAGKNIVFFATTNEVKFAISSHPKYDYLIMDSSVSFTNRYGYCLPKFVYPNPPTWYALETNDVEHLAFFSNLVESIVIGRNRNLLYMTLRDAIKSDETGSDPYKTMSALTMRELFWTDDETNLVQALYDPLLAPRFRRHALFQLKKRFGWPETNTVPEP